MADLLGQIANPQMADIAGALDYRQKKLMEDEQRRKEIQFNQLAGQALSTGLKPDSVLAKLAMAEPAKYVMIAKTLGLDPANGAEGASLMDDVSAIYQHSVTGAEDGMNFVNGLIETRNKLGLDTSKLQSLVELGSKNPNAFLNSISTLHNTFNPSKPDYEMMKIQNEQAKIAQADKFKSADLALEQKKLDLEQQKAIQGGKPKQLDVKDIQSIQKDVSSLIQATQDTHKAALSMENLKSSGSPLSMQAAIIQFNKALDPGSVVKTEEGRIISSSGGAMEGLIAKYNDALGKGKLTPEVFQDIVDTSKAIANSAIDSSTNQIGSYLDTYGDTLDKDFKGKLANRVPKKFEIKQGGTSQPKKSGGTLMIDANGNKAYVYPDGTHEEVR